MEVLAVLGGVLLGIILTGAVLWYSIDENTHDLMAGLATNLYCVILWAINEYTNFFKWNDLTEWFLLTSVGLIIISFFGIIFGSGSYYVSTGKKIAMYFVPIGGCILLGFSLLMWVIENPGTAAIIAVGLFILLALLGGGSNKNDDEYGVMIYKKNKR